MLSHSHPSEDSPFSAKRCQSVGLTNVCVCGGRRLKPCPQSPISKISLRVQAIHSLLRFRYLLFELAFVHVIPCASSSENSDKTSIVIRFGSLLVCDERSQAFPDNRFLV